MEINRIIDLIMIFLFTFFSRFFKLIFTNVIYKFYMQKIIILLKQLYIYTYYNYEIVNEGYMQKHKKLIVYIILILFLLPAIAISSSSQTSSLPTWNDNWSYRQEIILPICTENEACKFQPIDIRIEFDKPCWGTDESTHSVRVLCWDGEDWNELESQIYDLEFQNPSRISKCGLVFLVPKFANGKERFFVYYGNDEKKPPNYPDHVSVKESFYYLEPISGVKAEGDYYEIREDGYCVYGVGQKGNAINRRFSQAIVKQKPKSEEFGLTSSDSVLSFVFSYHTGVEDEDEVSSDQKLVSKKILVDGNLMVEFKIVSESTDKSIRTSNLYKYYFCPTDDKRINIHVKHKVFEGARVKGVVNVDGRFGVLGAYHSKSERLDIMRFGGIFPYLHVFSENGRIREYHMNPDPDDKNREWIIPYTEDCDLGEDAWISYDNGEDGKANGILFASNENIVKSGTNERDGIQVKVAEKEYLNILGTEVDYAAINFGRNSYEKGSTHDLNIPNNLLVEFDVEFFTSEEGGFPSVIEEAEYFRELVKHRHKMVDDFDGDDQNIHTLTVIPQLTGRLFSTPFISGITGINFTSVYAELYMDNKLIQTNYPFKPFLGGPRIKFSQLASGEYIVKIYRKIRDDEIRFIGFESVNVLTDTRLDVFCTWPKDIITSISDQNGKKIENVDLYLFKNETLISSNTTGKNDETVFTVPFNLLDDYTLIGYYNGFKIYEEIIPRLKKNINIDLSLYEVSINIEDNLGFPPGVNVRPYVTSLRMYETVELLPEDLGFGKYVFTNLPISNYDLRISFGGYSDVINIDVPNDEDIIDVKFGAEFDLTTELLDSRGSPLEKYDKKIDIIRQRKKIYSSIEPGQTVSLPPAEYTINVYSDNELVGINNIEFSNSKNVKIVTNIDSIIPILITVLILVFIVEIVVLMIFKKISLNTFLKLLAMALVFLSVFHPWWGLNASSDTPNAEKTSEMFLYPQTMIETVEYNSKTYLDLATIPEMFTNLLGTLFIVVSSGFFLIGFSFIPNILLKRRYSTILISASVLFLILVVGVYYYSMSKITEISLGSLQGKGILDVILPDETTVYMTSSWGLGSGFYICIAAALTAFLGGVIDYLRKRKIF